ncbi:MAG TPA: apolipoprotein N-acyltransferase [Actinomycetota bacterium]|nr:apolipoprotein N-acyltransferase [Actinomycetota bacterium]
MPRLRLRARPGLPLASAISAAAGLALSAAFPPIGAWPIAFVALVPLLWLSRERPGRGFVLGLAFGLTFHGATLYWILRFGEMAWVSLTLVSALWVAAFGALLPGLRRPGRPVVTVLAVASAWTVLEWLKGMWPLGGFTWGTLGISQVDNVATARLGTVAGVWGVTFAVVATNAAIALAFEREGPSRGGAAALGLAAILVVSPLALPFATAQGQAIDVAAIQIDVREAEDGTSTDEDLRVAELNIEQHRRLVGGPVPDLVVWGEGALDPGAVDDPGVRATVSQVVAAVGAPTIIGAVVDDPDGSQHTSVLQLDGSGNQVGRYDKTHLVPFGEYVPFRSRLEWVDAIDQVPVDRVPGDGGQLLSSPGLPPFATPICYENSFPAITRSLVSEGAGFVVVPVNNASYGFTAASAQHLQMSQMRAIETGRWYVNAAISGISAFVDPSGRVVASAGLFEPDILRHTIRMSEERTWYVRLGDWLPWLTLCVVVLAFAIPRRRRPDRPAPAPSRPDGDRRTLVILPTYDERATVEQVLRGVRKAPQDVDVVVIDDSSPDATASVVRDVMATEPHIRLVERPRRSGLASAYLDGFRIALEEGYDLVVEMDSDLSHDPSELPMLLEAAGSADLVVGSRYVPGGSVTNWSRGRVALSRAGNTYARWMLGIPLHDATSGFRVYRRALLEDLVADPIASEGYGFQIELVLRSWQLGATLAEVPITFREREHGQSKLSRGMVVEALWLVMRWGLADRFGGVPARPAREARPGSPDAE